MPNQSDRESIGPRQSPSAPEIQRPLESLSPNRPQLENNVASRRHLSTYQERGRDYRLRPAAFEAMKDIGRFRTIAVNDLAHHKYSGDISKAQRDLGSLKRQGLIELRTIWA